jgi:hypothetical protein
MKTAASLFGVLCVAFLLVWIVSLDKPASTSRAVKPEYSDTDRELDAMEVCQQEVKKKAAYPGTVEFGMLRSSTRKTSDGGFMIEEDFTAKNAFGADLPFSYLCVTRADKTVAKAVIFTR